MRFWKSTVMVGVAVLFLAGPTLAYYDTYDDSEAHPLRIAAYALYPVGFTLEWLVMRPLHAVVSQPELEPIFGHTPHGWDFNEGMPQVSEVTVAPPAAAVPPPPAVSPADIEAARQAAEEARRAAEEAKRAAEDAARAAEKATRGFEKSLRK